MKARHCQRLIDGRGKGGTVKEKMPVLNLEVEEIESRERGAGNCTSSTTSRHCTCLCFITTSRVATTET